MTSDKNTPYNRYAYPAPSSRLLVAGVALGISIGISYEDANVHGHVQIVDFLLNERRALEKINNEIAVLALEESGNPKLAMEEFVAGDIYLETK